MALNLVAVAGWESAVLASIAGASGTPDERDAQITRSGMYAEYPAIVATYVDLIEGPSDPASRLEALKRAVFLVWYSFLVPSVDSGISELPESLVRGLMEQLDRFLGTGAGDDELRGMLAWYRDTFAHPFDYFGPVRSLDAFIRDTASDDARRLVSPIGLGSRGQLGAYWSTVVAG